MLLALTMAVSGLPGLGNMEAYATELDINTYLSTQPTVGGNFQYIGSDASALVYGDSEGHNGTNSHLTSNDPYTFNIAAIIDEAHKRNNTKGYYPNDTTSPPSNAPTLRTAYSNNWFKGYYAFGKPYRVGEITAGVAPGTGIYDTTNTRPVDPIPTYDNSPAPTGDGVRVSGSTHPGGNGNMGLVQLFNDRANGVKKNGEITTIPNPNGGNVEVRSEYKTSADGQYIIIEYTVYNDSAQSTHFNIGHETDTQIYNHDACPIIVTEQSAGGNTFEGLHMIANSGSTYQFTNFDVLTYTPDSMEGINAGMQKRDANDKSENRAWAGVYSTTGNHPHPAWVFSKSPASLAGGFDSAAAFSAYFDLNPYEIKSTRFALSMKPSVYYVKNGAVGGTGFIATPVGSIAEAVQKIKASGTKKAYIYLMDDVAVENTVTIDSGISITIQTTDFVMPTANTTYITNGQYYYKNPPVAYNGNKKVISRGSSLKEDMFKVTGGASLYFNNVAVDGNGTDTTGTIVKVDNGVVGTRINSELKNNTITPNADNSNENLASAIELTGANSRLDMNYGTITDNKSIKGPAVRFSGKTDPNTNIASTSQDASATGNEVYGLTVNNTVKISGNTNAENKPANLKLGTNTRVRVTGNIGGNSVIGVSMETLPPVGQKAVVADGLPTAKDYGYSAANFTADLTGNTISLNAADNTQIPGGNVESTDPVVLTATEKQLTIRHINDGNGVAVADNKTLPVQVGDAINYTSITANPMIGSVAWNANTAGYNVVGVDVTPSATFTIDNSNHSITGTMPNAEATITFKYRKKFATYYFDSKGGNNISPLSEAATGQASTLALPTPTKLGYVFQGWTSFTDANGDHRYNPADGDIAGTVTTLPTNVVEGDYHYFASWVPGTTPYNINVIHSTITSRLQRKLATIADQKPIDARYDTQALLAANVPGYKISPAALSDTPSQTEWAGTTKFDSNQNYSYSIKMRAESFEVNYKYGVDPTQTFPFTITHKRSDGTVLSSNTVNRTVEQVLNVHPTPPTDFAVTSATIITGKTGTLGDSITTSPTRLIGTDDFKTDASVPDFDANYNFSSFMPNQPLHIEYTYAPIGDYFIYSIIKDNTNGEVLNRNSVSSAALVGINRPVIREYGYLFNQAQSTDDPDAGNFAADSTYTGNMPNANLYLNYMMDRDPALWSTMNFAVAVPYNTGRLVGPTSTPYLMDNGSSEAVGKASTLAKLKEKNLLPTPMVDDAPYYKFDGWYKDIAGTIPVSDTETFSTSEPGITLYAKFIEDPAYWIDIHFNHGENGSLVGVNTLHTKIDHTWADIASVRPNPVPVANYLFRNWTTGSTTITDTSALVNGATYVANFKKDPAVWGTDVGHITATGSLDENGKGKAKVNGVVPDNVYIITDLDGNIIDVITGPDPASDITFKNLYPGTRYNVYEGQPGTQASPGNNIASVDPSVISSPQEILVPTLDGNYSVGYDENNQDKVKIVVNPADPDSDYALIDENGNVVPYPDSDNGWKTPIGQSPSTVTFDNLDPNVKYTVVARKKGDTTKQPLDKLGEGSEVITNPGSEFETTNYIVDASNGIIESVNDETLNIHRKDDVKRGDRVKLLAPATDIAGNAFKYWKVINGHNSAITGRVLTQDLEFEMEAVNIVLKAVYEHDGYPNRARVEEEVKGGAATDFALNPSGMVDLENALTTDADRVLMGVNGADVSYRIVFNKRDAKGTEKSAVKPESISGTEHEDAFTTAWSLDVYADRYVDGRKVSRATDSNATAPVNVQLDAKDIDMLDYELFDLTTGSSVPFNIGITDADVVPTSGLFSFQATMGHTYVLVYSRTFAVTFVDNNPVKDHLHLNDFSRNFLFKFKVRRKERVTDNDYSFDYLNVTNYADGTMPNNLVSPFEDIYGVQYDYVNWSTRNMPAEIRAFDPDMEITKRMVVYAYYFNNKPAVDEARQELTGLIHQADDYLGNPFLRGGEIDRVTMAIAEAQSVLDKVYPIDPRMANYVELQAQIDLLRRLYQELDDIIQRNNNRYISRTGGSSGGGAGTTGRGNGSTGRALSSTPEKYFMLGVDGNWKINPHTNRWGFYLHGGNPLNNAWGKIQYQDEVTGQLLTKWYFFDGQSSMVTGWHRDAKLDKWYYLNPQAGANNGQMVTSWLKDTDNHWYFLDPTSGEMYVGWNKIGEKWYYFATSTGNNYVKGALYVNTTTPDGYRVNTNGEWVQ